MKHRVILISLLATALASLNVYAAVRSQSVGSGTFTAPSGVTVLPNGDLDGDGVLNALDPDTDGDAVPNAQDAFPNDVLESLDTDNDGIGNNADTDDDGDGVPDVSDIDPLDPLVTTNTPPAFAAITCPTATADIAYSCTISATDVNGHTLTYTLANGPSWMTINSATGVISGTPLTNGTVTGVQVSANDGHGTTTSPAFSFAVDKSAAQIAAETVATAITDGTLAAADITTVLSAVGSTADSDLDLSGNPIHMSYVQNCIGSSTDATTIANCSSNVDGAALSQYETAEVLSGSQTGTVDSALLEKAGISSTVATIAAGNTCGANQDQSCVDQVLALAGISSSTGITTANFENILANYFETAVASEPLTVATATGATGCSNSQTVFNIPNPPTLCASFAHWNCSGITSGISVAWTDSGKGSIQADSTVFSGGAYQVRATLNIGNTSRTKTLNGNFNLTAAVSGAQNGYKTGTQPGYWGGGYNPVNRASSQCSWWGGTLAKHSEIRAANTAHGTIISNGTRVVFRTESGDAAAYTGSGSTTKPQCSQDFHQTNSNNINGFQYRNNNNARCNNRTSSENFTYLCKDVPSCN